MKITHHVEKHHANADDLNRLHDEKSLKETDMIMEAFPMTVMGLDESFIQKIQQKMKKDGIFAVVIRKLDSIETTVEKTDETLENREWTYHDFKRGQDDILYYQKTEQNTCLYISANAERKIFEMTHEANTHAKLKQVYEKIYKIAFVFHLRRKLTVYITECSVCQRSKPQNDRPYDKL